jgi:hypothetical protein
MDSIPSGEPHANSSAEEGSVNQNEISDDGGENPGANRDGNGAEIQQDVDEEYVPLEGEDEEEEGEGEEENEADVDTEKDTYVHLKLFRDDYRAFCSRHNIPGDVSLNLVQPEDITFGRHHITVPLMAISEGGLRFPVNQLLREFLHEYQLNPRYLAVNSFRIINAVDALRERFNLTFTLSDLIGVYNVSRNKSSSRRFLSLRCIKPPRPYLIDHLPDSDPWANDFVEVRGNFEFGPGEDRSYPIPRGEIFLGCCTFLYFDFYRCFDLLLPVTNISLFSVLFCRPFPSYYSVVESSPR